MLDPRSLSRSAISSSSRRVRSTARSRACTAARFTATAPSSASTATTGPATISSTSTGSCSRGPTASTRSSIRETTEHARRRSRVDASASMDLRGRAGGRRSSTTRGCSRPRSRTSSSRQGDAVGLVVYADALRQYLPSRGGQRRTCGALLVALTRTGGVGRTDGRRRGARRAIDLLKRRGLLIVVSDLYDEDEAVEQALTRAASRSATRSRSSTCSRRDEVELPFRGDVELEDLETGRTVLDRRGVGRRPTGEAFAAFLERWRTRCSAYGIDYTRVITDMPLDAALRGYLLRRRRRGLRDDRLAATRGAVRPRAAPRSRSSFTCSGRGGPTASSSPAFGSSGRRRPRRSAAVTVGLEPARRPHGDCRGCRSCVAQPSG